MPSLRLTLKEQPTVPLEAEVLTPDVLGKMSHAEVCAQQVFLGKHRRRLDDFFEIEGDGADEIEIHGDARQVKYIGQGMTRGRITVRGNVGMHLGAAMHGGEIHVHGNASDWVGAEMRGGHIHVRGNAGGQAGAAYRGSMAGMQGGSILIEGTAGLEVGMRMKRGIIAIRGRARDFTGLMMKGGTIVLMSGAEIRTGAWMERGTIISLRPLELLPTFSYACDYNPVFVNLYASQLKPLGFDLPHDPAQGVYRRHAGDSSIPGKGELLVWQAAS
jgi:formylmethanofuran dehydrogenase subunit C